MTPRFDWRTLRVVIKTSYRSVSGLTGTGSSRPVEMSSQGVIVDLVS
jgi:hypothetical protein